MVDARVSIVISSTLRLDLLLSRTHRASGEAELPGPRRASGDVFSGHKRHFLSLGTVSRESVRPTSSSGRRRAGHGSWLYFEKRGGGSCRV